jgi:hypothetical protein
VRVSSFDAVDDMTDGGNCLQNAALPAPFDAHDADARCTADRVVDAGYVGS